MKYGRLTIIGEYRKYLERTKQICRCDCGKVIKIEKKCLISGNTKSCGCFRKEMTAKRMRIQARTHGESRTPFYKTWRGMNERCYKKWSKDYKNYGKRGIKIEWDSFEKFRDDMKLSYQNHVKRHGQRNTTIERMDVNGNYCKKNCQWATFQEQANNTRNSRKFILNGVKKTISQWARHAGMSSAALRYRLNQGLDIQTSISLKLNHGHRYAKFI